MPQIPQMRGPYIYNLDSIEEVDERIPRRRGFWFTSGRHRTRRVARRRNVARNSDSPIRDPDHPPMRPRYDEQGRRYEDQRNLHRQGDLHLFVNRDLWRT